MAKTLLKEKCLKLRKQGRSIRDIANTTEASKSSVSYWCRDIKLSKKQIDNLERGQKTATMKAILKNAEINRAQRIYSTRKQLSLGKKDIGKLNKRDLFITGIALYWAEGYKKGSEETGFTNSDKDMIKLFIRWLDKIYQIKKKDLILRVSINITHKNRVGVVLEYWSSLTKIPLDQFTKTSLIKSKSKKVYENRESHFGTLRIKVRRGTNLRRRILGSIEALAKA